MKTAPKEGSKKPWSAPRIIVSEMVRNTAKNYTSVIDKPNVYNTTNSYASGS